MPVAAYDVTNLRYMRFDNVTNAVIEKESGISKRLIDIWVDGVPDRSYVDINVGTKRIARLPLKWNDCTFVSPSNASMNDVSVLQFFAKIFPEFAVEADEDEDITLTFNATMPTVHVLYTVQKAGIDKSKLGRSGSPNIVFACPITHSATVNASGNYSLNSALIPTGFPEIRDGFVIPSGRQFVLKAMAFGSTSVGGTTPTRLHIWDDRLELFTPVDHSGLGIAAGRNILAANVTFEDVVIVKDYVFPAGHKLTLNFDATYDGANVIAANTLALFLIGLYQVVR